MYHCIHYNSSTSLNVPSNTTKQGFPVPTLRLCIRHSLHKINEVQNLPQHHTFNLNVVFLPLIIRN